MMLKKLKDLLERIPAEHLEPIELRDSILNEIEEHQLEAVGDGRRRLHNRLRITLLHPDQERRNRLRHALQAGIGLKQRLITRCSALDIEVPASLSVLVEDAAAFDSEVSVEFTVEGWTEAPPAQQANQFKSATLTLLSTGETLQISSSVFRVGREKQPTDRSGRPKPENNLFFGESETSVSRQHAEIRLDRTVGEYRLWDLGSTQGTRIVRDDAEVDVPRSARAPGERLRSGDVIYFGRIGVQFQTTAAKVRKARRV